MKKNWYTGGTGQKKGVIGLFNRDGLYRRMK